MSRKNSIPALKEYYKDRNWYNLVRDFHIAFGHPFANLVTSMPLNRRIDRAKWISEEMWEFVLASNEDLERQVDALIDALYFILGTFVEIGVNPYEYSNFLKDIPTYEWGFKIAFPDSTDIVFLPPNPLPRDLRVEATIPYNDVVFEFISASNGSGAAAQIQCMFMLMEWAYSNLARLGVDPSGLFEAVHEANMGKLWPDGKPRYRDDGKIRKPTGWESSRNTVQRELIRRIEDWYDENDIPF